MAPPPQWQTAPVLVAGERSRSRSPHKSQSEPKDVPAAPDLKTQELQLNDAISKPDPKAASVLVASPRSRSRSPHPRQSKTEDVPAAQESEPLAATAPVQEQVAPTGGPATEVIVSDQTMKLAQAPVQEQVAPTGRGCCGSSALTTSLPGHRLLVRPQGGSLHAASAMALPVCSWSVFVRLR